MAARQCFHCKQWVNEGEAHACWTTSEAALTQNLTEDLREAWERLRETAVSFSRQSYYFLVRPKRNFLELCVLIRVVGAARFELATPCAQDGRWKGSEMVCFQMLVFSMNYERAVDGFGTLLRTVADRSYKTHYNLRFRPGFPYCSKAPKERPPERSGLRALLLPRMKGPESESPIRSISRYSAQPRSNE